MLMTLMLPYQVTLIPQYVLFLNLGWVNTFLPLIVPKFLAADAFFIFLMVQFFRGIPRELDEAATIQRSLARPLGPAAGGWLPLARGHFLSFALPMTLTMPPMLAVALLLCAWPALLQGLRGLGRHGQLLRAIPPHSAPDHTSRSVPIGLGIDPTLPIVFLQPAPEVTPSHPR